MVVEKFNLLQNYPNPFNPITTIEFTLDKNTDVELAIYNLLGEKIKTLVNSKLQGGLHSVQWDGTNEAGVKVGTGIYYYMVKTNDGRKLTRKMLLLK
jgi:flagellar hook assembly protein FlgD